MKQYSGVLIVYGAFLAVGAGVIALLTKQYIIALGVLGAGLILMGVLALMLNGIQKRQQARMDSVFRENDSAVASLVQNISIPCAPLNETSVTITMLSATKNAFWLTMPIEGLVSTMT